MTAPPWPAGDYETEPPSVTLLLCRAAPASGGLTTFVDTVQAADALTAPDRALAEVLTVVRFGRLPPAFRHPPWHPALHLTPRRIAAGAAAEQSKWWLGGGCQEHRAAAASASVRPGPPGAAGLAPPNRMD